jgi:hypothetical protein
VNSRKGRSYPPTRYGPMVTAAQSSQGFGNAKRASAPKGARPRSFAQGFGRNGSILAESAEPPPTAARITSVDWQAARGHGRPVGRSPALEAKSASSRMTVVHTAPAP